MKKFITCLYFAVLFPVCSYAGLLSFLGDVSSISTAMGSSKGNGTNVENIYNILDSDKILDKNAQAALKLLGFYSGTIDGNMNTYSSRKAIISFQKAFGYDLKKDQNWLETLLGGEGVKNYHKGILAENTLNDLVYLFELTKEFDEKIFGEYQLSEDLKGIYQATQELESDLSRNGQVINKISESMNSELAKGRKNLLLDGIFVDVKNQTLWLDTEFTAKFNYYDAGKYCSNMTFNGISEWELPTPDLLKDAYTNNTKFTHIPPTYDRNWPHFWSSVGHYAADFKKDKMYTEEPTENKLYVRCVYSYASK